MLLLELLLLIVVVLVVRDYDDACVAARICYRMAMVAAAA